MTLPYGMSTVVSWIRHEYGCACMPMCIVLDRRSANLKEVAHSLERHTRGVRVSRSQTEPAPVSQQHHTYDVFFMIRRYVHTCV